MKAEMLQLNTDGTEAVLDAHKYWADGSHTKQQMEVFQGAAKSYKVEQFKHGIAQTIRALKFAQYEASE